MLARKSGQVPIAHCHLGKTQWSQLIVGFCACLHDEGENLLNFVSLHFVVKCSNLKFSVMLAGLNINYVHQTGVVISGGNTNCNTNRKK